MEESQKPRAAETEPVRDLWKDRLAGQRGAADGPEKWSADCDEGAKPSRGGRTTGRPHAETLAWIRSSPRTRKPT